MILPQMNIPEQHRTGRSIVGGIAQFARERQTTHFLTLKLGLHCALTFDPDRELAPYIGRLLAKYAHRGRGLPHRRQPTGNDVPFLFGVPEFTNKSGALDPHFHGYVTLGPSEEPIFRGFLREAWGVDMTKGDETLPAELPEKGMSAEQRSFLPNLPVTVTTKPSEWISRGAKFSPTFDLQPIYDHDNLARYITKKTVNPIIWTSHELLDTKRPSKTHNRKSPASIRH